MSQPHEPVPPSASSHPAASRVVSHPAAPPPVGRPRPAGDPEPEDWPAVVRVVPWVDPLIDRLGHDARSEYVETFWLGVLGPSATWFLRRCASWFEAEPDGFEVELAEVATLLGLSGGGRRTPFHRVLDRCLRFGMAQRLTTDLAVRRRLPPLSGRHLVRLSPALQAQHARWTADRRRAQEVDTRERARQLALSLVRLGEDVPAVEQQLARWRIHPAAIHDAVAWALARAGAGEALAGPIMPAAPAPAVARGTDGGATDDPHPASGTVTAARPAR